MTDPPDDRLETSPDGILRPWQELRRRAAEQAAALADDDMDLAESRAIQADLAELRAW